MSTATRATLVALCLAASAAPAAGNLEPWEKRWKAFEERMALCTDRHRYDPATSDRLDAHVLGEGELEWRECAYEGLLDTMAVGSPAEDAYRRLIFEDRRMTRAIVAKRFTRAKRKERLLAYLDQVHDAESKERDLRSLEKERDVFVNRMNEIKRMRDMQRYMR